jgi:hypothetical protein
MESWLFYYWFKKRSEFSILDRLYMFMCLFIYTLFKPLFYFLYELLPILYYFNPTLLDLISPVYILLRIIVCILNYYYPFHNMKNSWIEKIKSTWRNYGIIYLCYPFTLFTFFNVLFGKRIEWIPSNVDIRRNSKPIKIILFLTGLLWLILSFSLPFYLILIRCVSLHFILYYLLEWYSIPLTLE